MSVLPEMWGKAILWVFLWVRYGLPERGQEEVWGILQRKKLEVYALNALDQMTCIYPSESKRFGHLLIGDGNELSANTC